MSGVIAFVLIIAAILLLGVVEEACERQQKRRLH